MISVAFSGLKPIDSVYIMNALSETGVKFKFRFTCAIDVPTPL